MKWISSKTKENTDGEVLLWFEFGGLSQFSIGYYDSPNDEWHEYLGDTDHIVDAPPLFWMRLPSAPEVVA